MVPDAAVVVDVELVVETVAEVDVVEAVVSVIDVTRGWMSFEVEELAKTLSSY